MTDVRRFSELAATERMYLARESFMGARYMWHRRDDAPAIVQRFDQTDDDALDAFVSLHHAAHLWVHEDYDHDAWYVLDVDEPIEVGTDFVVMQHRMGNSIRQFEASDDPPPLIPRLAELRALVPKLQAAAQTPRDVWLANLVASRVCGPDENTIYIVRDNRFYVQDLWPTTAELRAWREVESRRFSSAAGPS